MNRLLYAVFVSTVVLVLGGTALAEADNEAGLSIEAQPLASALREFSEQTGLQIGYAAELADNKVTSGVEGTMDPDMALDTLLASSGLEHRFVNDSTVIIRETVVSDDDGGDADSKKTQALPVLMAQNQTGQTRTIGSTQATSDEDRDEMPEPVEIEEILVTGSAIRGVRNESAPIDVYSLADIESSGATTLERFFETLPQNLNSETPIASEVFRPTQISRDRTIGGGVNLRGLGAGTSLVLINGRRFASPNGRSIDTSLIPLGVIERVEVLSDGASAVYGSDAIGGVINIILREDMDGGEVSSSYATVDDGDHDRFQAAISAGTSWGSGSGFVSYTYLNQTNFQAGDRDFVSIPDDGDLIPDEERHSFVASIEQDLTDRLSTFGNVLYSEREAVQFNRFIVEEGPSLDTDRFTEAEQIFLSTGLVFDLSEDLFLEAHGSYFDNETSSTVINVDESIAIFSFGTEEEGDSVDLEVKLDGRLLTLASGDVRFALGGGYSEQTLYTSLAFLDPSTGFAPSSDALDRDSVFAFAEAFVPLVNPSQRLAGAKRLELNAAIRYTEYSDFGSAATPRLGILWSPIEGLDLRSTYSRGFRAPALSLLGPSGASVSVSRLAAGGRPDTFSADGSSIMLLSAGAGREGLGPELSDSFTVGVDIEPVFLENLDISVTYYYIDYTDRLGTPDPTGGFAAVFNQEEFGFAFDADPTPAELAAAITNVPATNFFDLTGLLDDPTDVAQLAEVVTVIFDNRRTNLAGSQIDGLDFSVNHFVDTAIGELRYGGSISYILDSTQKSVPSAPEISVLNSVGNPIDLIVSSFIGIQSGGMSGQVNLNYRDGYKDGLSDPERPVSSWTTVDINLRYAWTDQEQWLLDDTTVSLTINNALDEDPPFVGLSDVRGRGLFHPIGFDPSNANALGRMFTLAVTKGF